MSETATKALVVSSIKDFAKQKGFVQLVPSVRVNMNGYPFVTFIDGDNKSENIYFSKKAAQGVTAGTPVSKEMIGNYQIAITENEEGEERIKLISNSDRVNIADLL